MILSACFVILTVVLLQGPTFLQRSYVELSKQDTKEQFNSLQRCNKTSVQYYLVISDCQRFTKEPKDQKDLKNWEDQEDWSYVFSLCSACVQLAFSLCSACVQLVLHSPNPLRLCYHSCILYSVYKNCGNSTS